MELISLAFASLHRPHAHDGLAQSEACVVALRTADGVHAAYQHVKSVYPEFRRDSTREIEPAPLQ